MAKLNQIVALVAGKKTRLEKEYGELNKTLQKHDLFNGQSRTYRPTDDKDTERLPSEVKPVIKDVRDIIGAAKTILVDIYDAVATQESGNCITNVNVVVDGINVVENVPSTVLLYLSKQLDDLGTFVGNIPVLDASEQWTFDQASGQYVTVPVETHRTKKVQKPIVLYDATEKHPAQTQLLSEDVIAGFWTTVKRSTAMPAPDKKAILERINKLSDAVKVALEEANSIVVSNKNIGDQILKYVFSGQ